MLLTTPPAGPVILAVCLIISCGQQPETKLLIDEINAAGVKARALTSEAESKRAEAREKLGAEHDRLIDEASEIYGRISEILLKSAVKADKIVMLQNPEWYQEYFPLQSRLMRNLAKMAKGAQEELQVRKSGAPSESQVKSWKEDIRRIVKENDELRRKLAEIESRQGVVLIT